MGSVSGSKTAQNPGSASNRAGKAQRGGAVGQPVVVWQQQSGRLLAASRSDPQNASLKVWDADAELCVLELPLFSSGHGGKPAEPLSVTALGAADVDDGLVHVGERQGSVLSFDTRLPRQHALVESVRVSVDGSPIVRVQTQIDRRSTVVAAARGGTVGVLDSRCAGGQGSVQRLQRASHHNKQGVSLDVFALHPYAPVAVSGSRSNLAEVFELQGNTLQTIEHHIGFLGQRLGGITALDFHRHRLLFVAGADDSYLSLFLGDKN
jgi:hypothetical protein